MFAASNFARTAVGALGAMVIATACIGVATAPAAAADTVKVAKVVRYADLNLASPEGRASLNARIKSAARAVCENPGYNVAARTAESRCVKSAIRAATAS